MCLNIEKDTPRLIAQEDIKCYKYVTRYLTKKFFVFCYAPEYLSPFYNTPYKVGELKTSDLGKTCNVPYGYNIEEGLHTFTSLQDVLSYCCDYRPEYSYIVTCTITSYD